MNAKKMISILVTAVILTAVVAGCSGTGTTPEQTLSPQQSSQTPQTPQSTASPDSGIKQGTADESDNTVMQEAADESESATYMFTDSAGREVELPRNIERIAPTGPLAQIVLISLCPDKLAGFASFMNDAQFDFIDKKYESLPVFGNFYADTLNLESVILAAPQVIIDIGETKPNANDDLEGIQERTGIPTVFIQMDISTIISAYETLGGLTGETEQASRLIEYISRTLSETEQKISAIPASERVKVYYAQDDGLTAVVSGTVHSDVIDMAGGVNVAVVEESIRGGASSVSMEQLMIWNPEIVLFAPNSIYDTVEKAVEWSGISAIRTGRFYEIPESPYNWMGRPPSVNRILGIKWLSNLLYPNVFNYDMISETREFYKLFYHCDITDAQVTELLAGSSLK